MKIGVCRAAPGLAGSDKKWANCTVAYFRVVHNVDIALLSNAHYTDESQSRGIKVCSTGAAS